MADYRPYTTPRPRLRLPNSPLQTLTGNLPHVPPEAAAGVRRTYQYGPPDPWYQNFLANHPANPGGGNTPPPDTPPPATPPSVPGYENDPIYQQIKALAQQSVADAQAQATASQKQLAIQLGDPGLANSLNLGADTAYAAQNNPYSTLANLLRGHVGNVHGINANTSAANLFFSSERGKELGAEQTGYGGARAGAANQAQSVLSQIAAMVLAAKQQAARDLLSGQGDYYNRHKDDPQDPGPVAPDQMTPAQAFYDSILQAAYKRALNPPARGPSGGI